MPANWRTLYQAAILEQDPKKLEDVCEQARIAVHNRILALDEEPADAREKGELEEALRQLTIHKYKRTADR